MSQNLDAAERYQLAIYDVPFDASSPHNYAVWQGFKLCRILAIELEGHVKELTGRLADKSALLVAVEEADAKHREMARLQLANLVAERDEALRIRDSRIAELEERVQDLEGFFSDAMRGRDTANEFGAALLSLVEAVDDCGNIDDVDGKNWFDLRDELIG